MNQTPDRLLVDWLTDGPEQGPRHGLDRALAATRRTNQRPGWTFASTWLPAPLAARTATNPRPLALLIAVALLAVALAAAVLLVGSARRAAPPFGLASNGNIVLDIDGSLWEANPDGSDPRPFAAETLGIAYTPVFSPDGTKVAYLTQAAEQTPKSIYVANADGSNAHNVTGDMPIIATPLDGPVWSPDGSRIAFVSSDNGNFRIYTVGPDGSGLTAVTGPEASRQSPSFSPDGKWLAYRLQTMDYGDGTHLAISRPDGSDERPLVSVPERHTGTLQASQWSPDSTRIAYSTGSFGEGKVGVVDLARQRTKLSLDTEDAFLPLWSPDGSRLLYLHGAGTIVDPDHPSDRVEIPAGLADCAAFWAPDATEILGFGTDCTHLFRIPVSDPKAATPIDLPPGLINMASWRRTAP